MLKYVGWKITSQCNRNCHFCYSVENNPMELSTIKICEGIERLNTLGLNALNVTGGEPMLRSDFSDICGYAKRRGIFTTLSTNGTLLNDPQTLRGVIDCLSISLDSLESCTTPPFHNNINQVQPFISLYNENSIEYLLKINTIVTQRNCKLLQDIADYLRNSCPSVHWKLIQPSNRGRARDTSVNKIELTQFYELVDSLRSLNPDLSISSWPSGNTIGAYYIIINTEGHLYLPKANDYEFISSLWDPNLFAKLQEFKRRYPDFERANIDYLTNSYRGDLL